MDVGLPRMRVPAAVTDGSGALRVAEIEIAQPGKGEVLVEIAAAGLCHTDIDSLTWGRPLVLGHEGAGRVRAVGPEVDLLVGTPIVLNWAIPCGSCFQCSAGRQSLCERRDDTDWQPPSPTLDDAPISRSFWLGTMTPLTVVRAEAVVPIHVDIAPRSACLIGCAGMTGYGSVVNAARVHAGTTVAVIGLGSVGLNVVQTARLAGARRVIAIGRSPSRLATARAFGATDEVAIVDADLRSAAKQVRELTGGRGADYAFECTGVPELATIPLVLVRHGGTAVQVSGNEVTVPVDLTLFEWDKTYLNPLYGQCRPREDIPRILDLYATGRFEIDALVSRIYSLDEIATAFSDLASGKIVKGIIDFDAT